MNHKIHKAVAAAVNFSDQKNAAADAYKAIVYVERMLQPDQLTKEEITTLRDAQAVLKNLYDKSGYNDVIKYLENYFKL